MMDGRDCVLIQKSDCMYITEGEGDDVSFKESAVKAGFSEEQAKFLEKVTKLVLF